MHGLLTVCSTFLKVKPPIIPFVVGIIVLVSRTCYVDYLRRADIAPPPMVAVRPIASGACLLVLSVLAPVSLGEFGAFGEGSGDCRLLPTLIDGIRRLLDLIGAAAIISSCFLPASRLGEPYLLVVFSIILCFVIDYIDFSFRDPLVLILDS